ncbi:hypothetical protein DFH28DRAFT_899253 [Melampsora americana]|nr:hypothetical protein DFH28DRAFT_899253 [Melampsora americana]
MLFKNTAQRLKSIPEIWGNLDSEDFVKFCLIGSNLIRRAGRAITFNVKDAPIEYLHEALNERVPRFALAQMWDTMFPCLQNCHTSPVDIVEMIGLKFSEQIPTQFIFPPVENCLVCNHRLPFKKQKMVNGYLYDLDGVHPIKSASMYCEGCRIAYRPSYYSRGNKRYFYTSQQKRSKDTFQVHQHYFMSRQLAESLSFLQMLSHVSIFNLVNHYNHTHKCYRAKRFNRYQSFGASMSETVCRDGLDIHRLLYHYDARNKVLEVPNSAAPPWRYLDAMSDQVKYWARSGTEYRNHACDKCVYISTDNEGKDKGM